MLYRLSVLINRVKAIYQEEGLLSTIRRIFVFIISILYKHETYYVFRRTLKVGNEADRLPKIPNVTHRIVETIEQLDELSNEGFDLSLLDIDQARYRLGKGAILALLFVDRELGHRGWEVLTEEAKKSLVQYPYKVDFANNEALGEDTWTNPKYRRQGLNHYSAYKKDQYLIGKGAVTKKGLVSTDNIASIRQGEKSGSKLVAKAHYMRILSLQFWIEKPVKSTDSHSN